MADTKFGFSQKDRPAPLGYRRFVNAMTICIIPAATALIEDWGLAETTEKRILKALIFLVAILKGIAMFLGNGQDYTGNLPDKLLLIIGLLITLSACKSQQQLIREKAKKEEAVRQQRFKVLQDTRAALPCTPVKITYGITRYLPGDTIRCPDGIVHRCPPTSFRVDTFRILDEAALAAIRDSLLSAIYAFDVARDGLTHEARRADKAEADVKAANNQLKWWRRAAIISWAFILICGGSFVTGKIKGVL